MTRTTLAELRAHSEAEHREGGHYVLVAPRLMLALLDVVEAAEVVKRGALCIAVGSTNYRTPCGICYACIVSKALSPALAALARERLTKLLADPEAQKRMAEAYERLEPIIRPLLEALERSERITAEDLAVRIHPRCGRD